MLRTLVTVPASSWSVHAFIQSRQSLPLWAVLSVALLLILPIYAPTLIRLFPLTNDVDEATSRGTDWLSYHQMAVNVLDEGLTIPAVQRDYSRPGGFGYIYFVALMYAVLGVRSGAVYFVQGLLLIGAIVTTAILFRQRFSLPGALLLTVGLVVFLAVDMLRVNTFHLLSENLLVPLIAVLLWTVLKAESTDRLHWFVLAGAVCGLCALTRPNTVFFGPAIASLIVLHPWHPQRLHRVTLAAAFIAAFAIVCSLLPLRNYAVTGNIGVWAALRPAGWQVPDAKGERGVPAFDWLAETARFYGARTAFAVGIPTFLQPALRVRPHLLLMWSGVVLYLWFSCRCPRMFWERLLLTLAAVYLLPLVAVAHITNHGFRMVTPVVLLLLPLAVKGGELALLASDTRGAAANPTR
jgi:Dolichyl-phosphate-mannose-protein mannosyltransferase